MLPLSVGHRKQLLIDDVAIHATHRLTRALQPPQRHPANPVLTGAEPWERWLVEPNGRAVLYDEAARQFKMWYVAPLPDADAPTGIHYKACYAVSDDGIHWTRPALGLVEWQGSRRNNLLPWGEHWMRRPNVMQDTHDPDPARRFKMTYVDVIGGQTAICKAWSPDGIHWRLNADGRPWFRREHNANLLGWDAAIARYVLYPRMPGAQNAVGRATSADFSAWSEPETVLAPGPSDAGDDFKGLAAFLYEGYYLGWLWVFDRNANAMAELAFSRDGVRWQRPFPRQPFFPRGEPGAWDGEAVLPVAPVVHGDTLWIYYCGWNIPYTEDALRRVVDGWVENGQRRQRAAGLATLPLDRLVAWQADAQGGEMWTKPLAAPGGELHVNARVRGELRVEVSDGQGAPRPGHTLAECVPVRGDGLRHAVRWLAGASLPGGVVQLRFALRDGELFAFGFGKPTGEGA